MTILSPFRSRSLFEDLFAERETGALVDSPEIQIKKSDSEYKVRAKIPGAKKENIKLEVENGYLKISGKYEEAEEKDYESIHSEFRSCSQFERRLGLDLNRVDVDKIGASFKEGLLEVSLPLKENEKPKNIAIEAA